MLRLLERGNAWVKIRLGVSGIRTSISPDWSLPVEYAQDLLRRFGVEKLFWGSDSPFVGHEHVASYGMAVERFKLCVRMPRFGALIGENGHRFYFKA